MAQEYVFISYAREDRGFVQALTERLRRAGVNTWTDLDEIMPGAEWEQAINRGIGAASALIYVASRHAVQSRWMDYEVVAFNDTNRRIFPIVLDEEGAQRMPLALRSIQWVDFRGGFDVGVERLLRGLGAIRGSAPVAAPIQKTKGYVFLSYADEDRTFVDELKEFLQTKAYSFWDYRDSPRDYQIDYSLDLENRITAAAGTLSVISPDWKRSATTFKELRFSQMVKVPVFLLMLRDPGPTLEIAGITYMDFTRRRSDGFRQLGDEMKRKGL
jgi:hypothetical protein